MAQQVYLVALEEIQKEKKSKYRKQEEKYSVVDGTCSTRIE